MEDLSKSSEMTKVAVMVSMLPEEIYEAIIPMIQETRCGYKHVKEKVVGTVSSKNARMELKSLDVGIMERRQREEEQQEPPEGRLRPETDSCTSSAGELDLEPGEGNFAREPLA